MAASDLQAIAHELLTLPRLPENATRRIDLCREALTLVDRDLWPADWAMLNCRLGTALFDRGRFGASWQPDESLEAFQRALSVFTRDAHPGGWAEAQGAIGIVHLTCAYRRAPGHAEAACEHLEAALQVVERSEPPSRRAELYGNLAEAWRLRSAGDQVENISRAIEYGERALAAEANNPDPVREARLRANLAAALMERRLDDPSTNLADARRHLHSALELVSPATSPDTWGRCHLNLAACCIKELNPNDPGRLARARKHLNHSLSVFTSDSHPKEWATAQVGLGLVSRDEGSTREAIAHFNSVLETLSATEFSEDCACAHDNLASVYSELGDEERQSNRSHAERHFAAALDWSGRATRPGQRRKLLQRLGALRFDAGDWDGALSALLEAADIDQEMSAASRSGVARELDVADTAELYARIAWCRLRTGAFGEALEQLERGKMRTAPGDRTRPALTANDILKLTPVDGALVIPLMTSRGGAVFVLPHGTSSVGPEHILFLQQFSDRAAIEIVGGGQGWLKGFFRWVNDGSDDDWEETILHTSSELWRMLMGPIHEHLRHLGVREGSSVILLPPGVLRLLPLQTAWRMVGNERRYFVDDYVVSYTPAAAALQACQAPGPEAVEGVVVIIDPKGDLPFALAEARGVRGAFPPDRVEYSEGADATRDVLLRAVPYSTLHLACHAFFHWSNSEQSSLLMADGSLSLHDLQSSGVDLKRVRLVTLSACESGVPKVFRRVTENIFTIGADEYVGLPAVFLERGAAAVVSSLWSVSDFSTALLMTDFYRRHRRGRQPVARALRDAQLWLRSLGCEEVQRLLLEEREVVRATAKGAPSQAEQALLDALEMELSALEQLPRDAQPFDRLQQWAAFIATGAV